MLTTDERRRYSRGMMLEGIGEDGQMALKRSSVLVVGAGALGSIVSMYMAGSGVGHIAVADFDTVDLSNLQRQLSFTEDDLGQRKAEATGRRLRSINSLVRVEVIDELITARRADELFGRFDVIVEGSDNPATKYLVSDAAVRAERPCVIGGVREFGGQVMTQLPGHACYRDLFPDAACDAAGLTPCAAGGVLGPLPGIVASVQAAEVIKLLTSTGTPLTDRLLLIDALDMHFTEIAL